MLGRNSEVLEAWTVLTALSQATETMHLGTLVSCPTHRSPAMLAKVAATLDVISNGRVELGIGAGWLETEHETYRFPFMSTAERFDELERQLAEINRQWGADDVWPKPVQQPRPPIIVGGSAKPRTVAAAVRFADEYNTVVPTIEQARERCQIVTDAARGAGREPLRFSMMVTAVVGRDEAEAADRERAWLQSTKMPVSPQLVGTVEQVAEALAGYEAVGVQRAMLQHLVHEDIEMVGLLGEVARALAD
jgi:alkanesulfonate monooxygenase SsuD/methylene tetrahydromethanopterin reductase-like flavin-dependent oxidoreductase (luciferase family)